MRLLISLVSAWCLWPPMMVKADFVSEVKQAWKQRQDQIATLTFEWEGTQCMARHSQPAGNDPRILVPKTDQTFKTNSRLALEIKGRVRFETSSKTWSERRNKLVPQHSIMIFDGSVKKTYYPKSNIEFPILHIQEGNSNTVAYDIRCIPIGLMYRPFGKQIGPGLNERSMTLSDRTGVVDKRKCRILEFESDEVWVDEERPFLPRKYVMLSDGHPRFSVTIHYDQRYQEKLFGWVPSCLGNHGVFACPRQAYALFPKGGRRTFSYQFRYRRCGIRYRNSAGDTGQ